MSTKVSTFLFIEPFSSNLLRSCASSRSFPDEKTSRLKEHEIPIFIFTDKQILLIPAISYLLPVLRGRVKATVNVRQGKYLLPIEQVIIPIYYLLWRMSSFCLTVCVYIACGRGIMILENRGNRISDLCLILISGYLLSPGKKVASQVLK